MMIYVLSFISTTRGIEDNTFDNKMLRLAQRYTTATRKFGIHIFVEVGTPLDGRATIKGPLFSIKIQIGPPYAIAAFI